MGNKYKTPKIDVQNVISFTCSDHALETMIDLLNHLHTLGEIGKSRVVKVDWDGDGSERINNIVINGMSLENWDKEWKRLQNIRDFHKYNDSSEDDDPPLYENNEVLPSPPPFMPDKTTKKI